MSNIKVLTYNVASTIGADHRADPLRCAEVIRKLDPEVAGVQELGIFTRRAPGIDAPAEIAKHTLMNYLFSRALYTTKTGGQYGIGAFSKYTMTQEARILLPVPEGVEPRTALIVKIHAPEPYYFCVTHFSYQTEFDTSEKYRTICAKLITDTVIDGGFFPCIFVGDLNTFPGSDTFNYLQKHWLIANEKDLKTPTCGEDGQIDFICAYPPERFEVKNFQIHEVPLVSDHYPVTAELILKPEDQ